MQACALRLLCKINASRRYHWDQGASTSRSQHLLMLCLRQRQTRRQTADWCCHWPRHSSACWRGVQDCTSRWGLLETRIGSWMGMSLMSWRSQVTFVVTSWLCCTSTTNLSSMQQKESTHLPGPGALSTKTLKLASGQHPTNRWIPSSRTCISKSCRSWRAVTTSRPWGIHKRSSESDDASPYSRFAHVN